MGGFTLRNLGLAVAATLIPASALAQQWPAAGAPGAARSRTSSAAASCERWCGKTPS